jgi:nicotianamine synthase-like protein
MQKQDLIACILQAHAALRRETDLSPRNPAINDALSALVASILKGCPPDEEREVLDHPDVRAVRAELIDRLAIAEGEMERCWGETFCARASLAPADLADFTYWDCYRNLVAAELGTLPAGLDLGKGESIAFVGAGPLPLSAILMHLSTGGRVTCIDRDPRACRLACELCRKAGLTGVEIACALGARYDYAPHPVVFVASLVPDKAEVMRCIRERCPHAVVALRSADGLCTLLYDPVDETELAAMGCGFLRRTGYNPQAINTTLFYEAAPALHRGAVRPAPAASPDRLDPALQP